LAESSSITYLLLCLAAGCDRSLGIRRPMVAVTVLVAVLITDTGGVILAGVAAGLVPPHALRSVIAATHPSSERSRFIGRRPADQGRSGMTVCPRPRVSAPASSQAQAFGWRGLARCTALGRVPVPLPLPRLCDRCPPAIETPERRRFGNPKFDARPQAYHRTITADTTIGKSTMVCHEIHWLDGSCATSGQLGLIVPSSRSARHIFFDFWKNWLFAFMPQSRIESLVSVCHNMSGNVIGQATGSQRFAALP
jgi:hypothetical protein